MKMEQSGRSILKLPQGLRNNSEEFYFIFLTIATDLIESCPSGPAAAEYSALLSETKIEPNRKCGSCIFFSPNWSKSACLESAFFKMNTAVVFPVISIKAKDANWL